MFNLKNNLFTNKYFVLILLSIHFLINIIIYLNTNTFDNVSDSGAVFDAYYSLIEGNKILPIDGYFFLTPAFIAFFINGLTGGGLLYYFIFQIILSSVTVYIIYKIILLITKSIKQAIIGILLIMFYMEYYLLGPVFYNQIYEIFFMSIFLLIIIVVNNEKKITNLIIYTLLLLFIIFLSLFFRRTLIFIFSIFFFLLLFNFKQKINLFKFSILAILSFIICIEYNPYKMFNSYYMDNTETLFWGHTLYGGHGGEASFVYPENENKYNEKLLQYIAVNNIDTITRNVINSFKLSEVKEFIKNEPHKWLFLQVKKIFYTFGSVPQRDGLLILYKGKINMPWIISALIIQIPYAIILIMFIICLDLCYKKIIQNSYKRIIYFIGLYLFLGICIFSAYQERYRPVIFICFYIPIIAINFNKLENIFIKENRRELFTKLIIILILLVVWMYQAYEAIVIDHERYFKVLQ